MFPKIPDTDIIRIDDSYSPDDVKAISMGEIETTTDLKKVLFTFGLSSCIGIYAYTKGFGILGHIDSGDMMGQHFEHEYKQVNGQWQKITKGFMQTGQIMYKIRQNQDRITEPIKIGMVCGVDAEVMCEEQIRKIDFAINSIVRMTEDIGLPIEKQEPETSSYVIVDTANGVIKTSNSVLYNKDKAR